MSSPSAHTLLSERAANRQGNLCCYQLFSLYVAISWFSLTQRQFRVDHRIADTVHFPGVLPHAFRKGNVRFLSHSAAGVFCFVFRKISMELSTDQNNGTVKRVFAVFQDILGGQAINSPYTRPLMQSRSVSSLYNAQSLRISNPGTHVNSRLSKYYYYYWKNGGVGVVVAENVKIPP